MKKTFLFILIATFALLMCSCVRPYDKPEYVQIDTN